MAWLSSLFSSGGGSAAGGASAVAGSNAGAPSSLSMANMPKAEGYIEMPQVDLEARAAGVDSGWSKEEQNRGGMNDLMNMIGNSGQDQAQNTQAPDTSAGQSAYAPVQSQLGQGQRRIIQKQTGLLGLTPNQKAQEEQYMKKMGLL